MLFMFIVHTIATTLAFILSYILIGYDLWLIQSWIISYIVTFILFVIIIPYISYNN